MASDETDFKDRRAPSSWYSLTSRSSTRPSRNERTYSKRGFRIQGLEPGLIPITEHPSLFAMHPNEFKSRVRESYMWFMSHQTRWSDNDQYGHINNSIYQHYFDTIINAYLIRHCGLDPLASPTIGLAVATSCQYYKPLSFPQKLDLGLRVNKLGTSSVTYEVGVFAADDAKTGPAAVGTFTHVFVDSKSRKAVSLPSELRTGLQRILVAGGGSTPTSRL